MSAGQQFSGQPLLWLDKAATLAVLITCGAILWSLVDSGPRACPFVVPGDDRASISPVTGVPSEPVSILDAATLGSSSALVALIGYSDFECPHCQTFARNGLGELVRDFVDPGRVLFVFRHLPLDGVRLKGRRASIAAECARRQGAFWAFHDWLFAVGAPLDDEPLQAHARAIQLDMAAFEACVDAGAAWANAELAAARRLAVRATPSFFIGRLNGHLVVISKRVVGASVGPIRAALTEVLNETTPR